MPHRYFSNEITEGTIFLRGADAKHLCVVMRAKAGESVTVCDGKGTDYLCALRTATTDCAELEVLSSTASVSEPTKRVILYVGYPKGDKLEWLIEKATELGAAEIVPFFSRYCVAAPKNEDKKNERYNRIALESAKQSGRGVVPRVGMPLTYVQMLAAAAKADTALFCYEHGGAPLHSRILDGNTIAIITGSEGGFSEGEAQQAQAAGCTAITLGKRILRCETAPIATLTAVMAFTGNLE